MHTRRSGPRANTTSLMDQFYHLNHHTIVAQVHIYIHRAGNEIYIHILSPNLIILR